MSLTPEDVQRMLDTLKEQHDAYYRLAGLSSLPTWERAEIRRRAKLEEAEAQCKFLAQNSAALRARLVILRTLYPDNPILVLRLLMADYTPDEQEQYLVNKIATALIAYGAVVGDTGPSFTLLTALCQGNQNREWMVKHAIAQRLSETRWSSSWIDILTGI